jgi:transposase
MISFLQNFREKLISPLDLPLKSNFGVRRVLGGLSTVKVGQMYGDSQRAVANWVQRFKKHGAKGLQKAARRSVFIHGVA